MKIIIGADVVPTKNNINKFIDADIGRLIDNELLSIWLNADVRIFNIEAPITECDNAIKKSGPNLRISPKAISGISALNPTVVTLANNHIYDYGEQGIRDTLSLLEDADIDYVGIRKDVSVVPKPYIMYSRGVRVGIYACAEHEFSIVSSGYGAIPYDPLTTFDDIIELKNQCDVLIVLYHGGRECYRYPSPELVRVFHKMAEKGADVVVAQHTHCIGCFEEYNGATLVYGQGNYIFDLKDDEYWNSGLLLEIDVESGKVNVNYIPFKKLGGSISLCKQDEKEIILGDFFGRSNEIKNQIAIENRYSEYLVKKFENEFRLLNRESLLFRIINRIRGGGLVYKVYNKESVLAILNHIECEAHREFLIQGIKQELEKFK